VKFADLLYRRYQQTLPLKSLGQETFIYPDTIKENIRFGQNSSDEDIIEAAKPADGHEFIKATSERYDTIIGD